MPICTTEIKMPWDRRSRRSPMDLPAEGVDSRRTALRISTRETEMPGHRRPWRSYGGSSSWRATPISRRHPYWVILNRFGGWRDCFDGGRTTSATIRTSSGDVVSVSFKLVEPPGVSFLTVDCPRELPSYPLVMAADGPLVLFSVACTGKLNDDDLVNYVVYNSIGNPSRPPSLSLLPFLYGDRTSLRGRPLQQRFSPDDTGLLCCRKQLFIVATIQEVRDSTVDMYLLLSGSDKWKFLERLPVSGSSDLLGWASDAVLPFRHRFLVWVDYFIGMIFADMTHLDKKQPCLWFVSLPVVAVRKEPNDWNNGLGNLETSRRLCVTCSGIKFVLIDNQHSGSFGKALHGQRSDFRISTWSLCTDDYKWKQDATMDAEELWALDTEDSFPHVMPEFPAVNVEDPDAICFLLDARRVSYDTDDRKWMIEVNMKKKKLGAVSAYSNEQSLSGQGTIESAKMVSQGLSFVPSKMPCYLYGRQPMKKRKSMMQEHDPAKKKEHD